MKLKTLLLVIMCTAMMSIRHTSGHTDIQDNGPVQNFRFLHISPEDPRFITGRYELRHCLYVFIDSTGDLSYGEVSSPTQADNYLEFTKVSPLKLFFRQQPYWLRLSIKSSLDREVQWLTNFMEGDITAFQSNATKSLQSIRSGLILPASQRYYGNHYGQLGILPIDIPSQGEKHYYWKIQPAPFRIGTDSGMDINYAMLSPSFLSNFRHKEVLFLALFIGFVLAVTIYHLVIYLYDQENNYLWFALYCFFSAVAGIVMMGYGIELFWPEIPEVNYRLFRPLAAFGSDLFLVIFSRSFLEINKLAPNWDKMLWGILGILGICLLSGDAIAATNPELGFIVVRTGLLFRMILACSLLVIPIICLYRGAPQARFYIIAGIAFLMGFIVTVLNTIGVIPRIDHITWIQMGALVQWSIFAFALAQSFRYLRSQEVEARRLQEIDAFKSRFFTNITHEFRTPITIILGMADRIKEEPQKWFTDGLEMIKRNGQSLLHFINQILDLSKVDAGAMRTNMVHGDIVPFLQYLVHSFHSLASNKKIALQFRHLQHENKDEPTIMMDHDPEIMEHILTNLVSNAIKFTPEGGRIEVSVSCIHKETKTSLSIDADRLEIRVKDNGPGILKEQIPYIFDRYYSSSVGTSTPHEGSGIGLALTKELVHLLQGEITVESQYGVGSCFKVRIPVTKNAPPISNQQLSLTTPTKSIQMEEAQPHYSEERSEEFSIGEIPILLIVEDHTDVITYLKSFLSDIYQITVARDGREGHLKAIEVIPDIIISDVMMPHMNGFELCGKIKSDMRTSHIPVILLTARADMDSRLQGLSKQADAYLAKPFNKHELILQIKNLLTLRAKLQKYYQDTSGPLVLPNTPDLDLENSFLQKVNNILTDKIGDESFEMSQLYPELGMSRSQFYRKFKALTNESIAHYFRKLRLLKARRLLQSTDLNITQVAFETGFKDPAHFSRAFKETFGQPPSEIT